MMFQRRRPQILVVDDFYSDPDAVRRLALDQEYEADERWYKGLRSRPKFLFPYVREEFQRLLGVTITDWTQQPANGSFQKTWEDHPLVYHSDTQSYAGAVYLNPNIDNPRTRPCVDESGTSFWQSVSSRLRRPSPDPAINNVMYSEHALLDEGSWDLIDRVGAVYNRLVLWDGQLVHSATSYAGFTEENPRLVHLFFFSVTS